MNKLSKKIKKILSIFIVIFLVSTVFAQAVSSKGLFSNLREKVKEAVNNVKDNILNKETTSRENNPHPIINKIKKSPLISSLITYSSFKTQSSLFVIYAKYGDYEKEASAGLGVPTTIDINDDGKNDVKAKVVLRLGIEKPFALSLKFKLKVDRLSGIDDIDGHLEVYAQLSFPGLLDSTLKGNKVRFGFLSEKYEDIPDSCEVTYKYIPYVFSENKPVHSTIMDPGDIEGKEELNILFSYIKNSAENENSDFFNVKLDPAVNTEMTLSGFEKRCGRSFELETSDSSTAVIRYSRSANDTTFNAGLIIYKISSFKFDVELTPFKKGGGRVEYIRSSNKPVDALLFFESTNKSNYFFADDIPSHIKVSWFTSQNNLVKIDTFGERCSSVGWRNALLEKDVTAKAYLTNLPSYFELNWIGKLGDREIQLTTDVSGCSAHIYASELKNGGYLYADFYSGENFDLSVYWNFTRMVFGISRSNVDLSVDVSFHNLLGMGESANVSFELKNEITSPFEFSFDEFLDFDAKIEFTGNNFEIRNLDVDLNLPGVGKFVLKANSFEMTRQSSMYFAFKIDNNNEELDVSCNIHVSNGVTIRGLILGFNDFLYPVDDIVVTGEYDHTVSLSVTQGFVEFHINKDGSGYIILSGGLNLYVDSDYHNEYGVLTAHVEGTISFLTEDDSMNISWTNSGALTIDGSGVLSLSGFKLWVKNKVNITISAIVGSFTFNAEDNSGNLNLVISDSSITLVTDFSLPGDLGGVILKGDFSIDASVSLSGNLKVSWGPAGIQLSTVGIGAGINGDLTVSNLYFKFGNTITLSANKIMLVGDLDIDANIYVSSGGIKLKLNSYGTSLLIKSFNINYPGMISTNFNELYLGAKGFIEIGSSSSNVVLTADASATVRVLGLYVGDNSFGIPSPLSLSFNTDLSGAGELVYSASSSYLMIYVSGSKPVIIDNFYINVNHGQILALWDKLHIKVNAHAEIKMSSKQIYLDASLKYVIFENAEIIIQNERMDIDGELTCTYSGSLNIRVDTIYSKNPKVEFDLTQGILDVTDFYLKYIASNGKYIQVDLSSMSISASLNLDIVLIDDEIEFDVDGNGDVDLTSLEISGSGDISAIIGSIYIEADLLLNLVTNTDLNEFNIEASGCGLFEITSASVYVPDMVDVSLGYFKLDLDDVKGSVIDLVISDSFSLDSASASGSITDLVVEDLYCVINFNIPGVGNIYVNISDLSVDFTGSGYFTADLTQPEDDILEASIEGSIDVDGELNIDYAYIWLILVGFELDDFSISGPTIFHLDAQGNINPNAADGEKIESFSLSVGCTSAWYASKLYILGMIGFDDFSGQGDISLGAEINGAVDIEEPSDDYFVIDLNGNWNWGAIKLFIVDNSNPPELGVGSFNGELTVKVDLALFFGLFDSIIVGNADIIIDVGSPTSFDLIGLSSAYNFDWLINIGPTSLEAGTYTIKYDISALGGDADYEGFVAIDTNNNWITLPVTLFNTFNLYGNFRTENWRLDWRFIGKIWDWRLNTSGTKEFKPGSGVQLYLDEGWRTLIGSDYDPNEFNAELIPDPSENTYYGGTTQFKAFVTNGDSMLENAKVVYEMYVSGSGWQTVDTKWTDEWGLTDFFNAVCNGDETTESRVVVSHPDYTNTKTITFFVEPGGGSSLVAYAGGPYEDIPLGENVQFTGSATGGEPPYSYYWTFGDGESSNQKDPIHSYDDDGDYQVVLTVTDDDGATASDTTWANVSLGAMNVELTADKMEAFVGDTVTFTATVSAYGGVSLFYRFDFDSDGEYDHTKSTSEKTYSYDYTYTEPHYWPNGYAPFVYVVNTNDGRSASDVLYFVKIYPITHVSGLITDQETGNPIQGATVSCEGSSTNTNSNGYYDLDVRVTDGGSYSISVTKDGYIPKTESIFISSPGETLTKDIQLLSSNNNIPPEVYIYAWKRNWLGTWAFIGGTNNYDVITDSSGQYAFSAYAPAIHPLYPDTNDPDGTLDQYRWEPSYLDSGWENTNNGNIPPTDSIWGDIVLSTGTHEIKLSVKDNDGSEISATLTLNIS